MRGLILIDGPDACGKTTLAQHFKEAHGARVFHLTLRFKDKMFTYQTAALRLALRLAETQLVVLDRHWPSDCIYASVFRKGTKWPLAGRMYDRVLMKHAALHILALPTSLEAGVAAHRANLDDDHPYDDKDFRAVTQRYLHFGYGYKGVNDMAAAPAESDYAHEFASMGGVFKERADWMAYRIDVEGKHIENFANAALHQLVWLQSRQPVSALKFGMRNWGGRLGTARWAVVLSNDGFDPTGWPGYGYTPSNAALVHNLASLGVMEHDLVWFNCDGDLSAFAEARSALLPLPALALGAKAAAFAATAGFDKVAACATPCEPFNDGTARAQLRM